MRDERCGVRRERGAARVRAALILYGQIRQPPREVIGAGSRERLGLVHSNATTLRRNGPREAGHGRHFSYPVFKSGRALTRI